MEVEVICPNCNSVLINRRSMRCDICNTEVRMERFTYATDIQDTCVRCGGTGKQPPFTPESIHHTSCELCGSDGKCPLWVNEAYKLGNIDQAEFGGEVVLVKECDEIDLMKALTDSLRR